MMPFGIGIRLANIPRQARRPLAVRARRPTLEALEERWLFSVSPPDAAPAQLVALPAVEEAAVPPGEVVLYRDGAVVQDYLPFADNDAARGLALRAALADAQAFDTIVLGAYTFNMGSAEHVELRDRITIAGAGKSLTKITSSCPQATDGAATFTLNNLTTVQDVWLEGSLLNQSYQPLVGMQGAPTENVTAYLRRVKITGDSDGIFIWTGDTYLYTINAYDCEISTRYDAIAVLGSGYNPQTVNCYNCSISVSQPDPIGAHTSNCVNCRSGNVNLFNSDLTATGDEDSLQTVAVWTFNQGMTLLANCTVNVSAPSGIAYDLYIQDGRTCKVIGGTGSGPDGTYVSSSGTEIYATAPPSKVWNRALFYNDSHYDDNDPLAAPSDKGAVATDKAALLPGGTATFANVSSYASGINGIIVDISGIHGDITADDFSFKVGNNNAPATWQAAPAPQSVVVLAGEGNNNRDRVEIVWNDGDITGQWLEVTVAGNADTGLAADDVFYFGNAPGDSGLGDTATLASVNSTDELGARYNPAPLFENIPVTNLYDYNRDGAVNGTDQLIARFGATGPLTVLRLIDLSPPDAPVGAGSPPADGATDLDSVVDENLVLTLALAATSTNQLADSASARAGDERIPMLLQPRESGRSRERLVPEAVVSAVGLTADDPQRGR